MFRKNKIAGFCDKAALFSLYVVAFQLPISKAIIEVFSTLAITCFILRKIILRESVRKDAISIAILLYLFVCLSSAFASTNFRISIRTFSGKTLQEILFFFALLGTLNTENRVKNFIYIFLFSSLILGIDGIYQYFTCKDFIRHRGSGYVPRERAQACFVTPNDFGCYLVSIIPFTLIYSFIRHKYRILRLLFLSLFFLLFICLVLTGSRGAWFGFISALLFMNVWIRTLGIFLLILGIIVMAAQQFYAPFLKERLVNFFTFTDPSSLDRKMIWEAAWKMFLSKPWLGIGLATFMFNFNQFVAPGYLYSPPYAHNCYLQMLAELGIIGLSAFFLILILFFYRGIKLINTGQRTLSWYVVLASLASILGYSVQMAVDTSLYSLDLGMLFWMMLGLGVAAMERLRLETVTSK